MELQGKIIKVGDTQTFGNDFTKRELVIKTDEQYPQSISIDLLKDKGALLDAYRLGDNVKVGINIGGREWVNPQGETKYFNSITGWRIEKLQGGSAQPSRQEDVFESSGNGGNEEDHDDLPF
jgi:hypothetical protein